ncbi:unnamed protein product [Lactuca virosa]|uniref:Uncharacterized protein n=1 Tax=Lactuca virosa TaxID=75947 RepID=A0AAU9N746_9ASTR|nr:unnamed protein product [Lactuca virosa]
MLMHRTTGSIFATGTRSKQWQLHLIEYLKHEVTIVKCFNLLPTGKPSCSQQYQEVFRQGREGDSGSSDSKFQQLQFVTRHQAQVGPIWMLQLSTKYG